MGKLYGWKSFGAQLGWLRAPGPSEPRAPWPPPGQQPAELPPSSDVGFPPIPAVPYAPVPTGAGLVGVWGQGSSPPLLGATGPAGCCPSVVSLGPGEGQPVGLAAATGPAPCAAYTGPAYVGDNPAPEPGTSAASWEGVPPQGATGWAIG